MSREWKRSVLILFAALLLFCRLSFADDGDRSPDLEQGTPADYASLKRFPQNLGGNFKALFSKKNIIPILVGGAASDIVMPFDRDIKDRVGVGDSSSMGKAGSVLGGPEVVYPAVAGLLIFGQYSHNNRFRSFSYSLAQGAVINEGLVNGLKIAVGRTRPDGSDNRSFPSGHAATSFMVASVAQHYYGWKAGVVGYSAATFISVSRARKNKHWASDLTAGATLGYIVGSSVSRRTQISIPLGKTRAILMPTVDLSNRSFGIWISTGSK